MHEYWRNRDQKQCGCIQEEQRPITQWRSLDTFWHCRDNLDFGGVEWICKRVYMNTGGVRTKYSGTKCDFILE